MGEPNPATTVTSPRIAKLIELEVSGKIKPEHQQELDTYRAQGLAPKKSSGNNLTEYQGKSTGFFERASGANTDFENAGEGGDPVGMAGDVARSVLPENVVNSFTSPARQKAEQAKKDFILASLRYESGAAINKSEFEAQDNTFFPQTGDSPEKIKQKAEARRRIVDSLKVAAGPGATNKPADVVDQGDKPAGDAAIDKTGAGDIVTPEDKEFKKQADELLARGGTRDDFDQLAQRFGRQPFDKSLDTAIRARETHLPVSGFRITPSGKKDASTLGAAAASPLGAYGVSAGDAVTLGFQDEIAGQLGGDTGQARLGLDLGRREHPYSSLAGSLTGGAIMPLGRGASTIKEMMAVGGGLGAAYGVGSGTDTESRLVGGGLGLTAGAAAGATFSKLGDLYRAKFPGGGGGGGHAPSDAADLAKASEDLKVGLLPADAGGTLTRYASNVSRMTPGGAVPITAAARRSQLQAGEALDNMASREGVASDAEAMGQTVREGALKYRSGSRDSIGRAYDRAATEAGDARVKPDKAMAALDNNIAELQEVPGGADGLAVLTGLKEELGSRGTVTVNGIRGMRTQLRQKFMKEGLVGSDLERRVNQVIDAAGDDLASSLADQGKDEAVKLFKDADGQWAARIKNLDDVIMPIIGKKGDKSGEQIASAVNAAAKGNNARLAKLFEILPEEEAGTARATLIDNLGKANAGAQNAAGDEFSFNTFLTNWNKIGNSAKDSIFRGENRTSIDQLALIAEKAKKANEWQNYSRTGASVMSGATLASGFMGLKTLGLTLGGEYAVGRLLSSPRVAKALLNIAQAKTPGAMSARVSALSAIAAKEPAISGEIRSLQGRLLSAMNDNHPASAAASEQEQEKR